jgi:hypothetical protein
MFLLHQEQLSSAKTVGQKWTKSHGSKMSQKPMGFSDGTRPGKHTREAIEAMVDLPIENGDFPEFFVCLPEGSPIPDCC